MRRIIGLLAMVGLMGLSFYPFPDKKAARYYKNGERDGVWEASGRYEGRKKVFMGEKL